MKNFKLGFIALLMATALISCNENGWLWDDPLADEDIFVAYQGKTNVYRGGNVDCSQIGDVLGLNGLSFPVSIKNDYTGGSFVNLWDESIPGLEVRVVGGNTVDWWTDGNIAIGNKCYKVGAVILKSATWSNVFYYGNNGADMDKGLKTYTGQALSNLTFCLVECKSEPEQVFAMKIYLSPGLGVWAITGEGGGLESLGYYPFTPGSNHSFYMWGDTYYLAGNIEIGNFDADPLMEVKVTLTKPGYYFTELELFVGTVGEFTNNYNLYPNTLIPSTSTSTQETFYDIVYGVVQN